MSRNFLAVPSLPYIGVPYTTPITVCDPSKNPPVLLPFPIQWLSYGASFAKPNVAVTANISQPGQNAIIDKIRSVYIDNLGCNVPVYVYFPSSGYTIACAPNSQGWFTAITNDLTALIVGEGFTDADSLSQTFVAFSNTAPTPYQNAELIQQVALYRASPSIQRGNTIYNSKFAPPALGDQTVQPLLGLTFPNVVQIFPVMPSGFYIVTYFQIVTVNLFNGGNSAQNVFFESTGVAGILAQFTLSLQGASQVQQGAVPTHCLSNANLKLDATQHWQLRNNGAFQTGGLAMNTVFTYIPDN